MSGVRLLAEPEGRTDETGSPETSAVQEGVAHYPRSHAGSSPLGVGVQALRGKPHPASDLESLDMHAGMDEPELLMQLLETIAKQKAGSRFAWTIVAAHAESCNRDLEQANETPRR
jgi:hypothetical protein